MDEPWKHDAKRKKPVTKDKLYDQSNHRDRSQNGSYQGLGENKTEDFTKYRVSVQDDTKMYQRRDSGDGCTTINVLDATKMYI